MRRGRAGDIDELEILTPETDGSSVGDLITGSSGLHEVLDETASRHRIGLVLAAVAIAGLIAGGLAIHWRSDLSSTQRKVADLQRQPRTPPPAAASDARLDFAADLRAHLRALRGHGAVAIAGAGHLRILDGSQQVMRDLYGQRAVDRPAWSPTGAWLSYVLFSDQVWVARADESQAHQVGVARTVSAETVSWSPRADTLAFVTGAGITVASADGTSVETLAGTEGASSLAWSPDGRSLAYVVSWSGADRLLVVDVSGRGAPRPVPPGTGPGDGVIVAGWWPDGRGVLVWGTPGRSASLAADGVQLVSVATDGTSSSRLTTMLPYRAWLSWSPDRHHIVVVEGGGREASRGKRLSICDVATGTCRGLRSARGTVALDPAWSPDGTQIAYVQADEQQLAAGYGSWVQTRELWTVRPDGSEARQMGSLVRSVAWPTWSPDGRSLLVEAANSLWLVDGGGASAAPVAEPLLPTEFPTGYYYFGFADWSRTVAWRPTSAA